MTFLSRAALIAMLFVVSFGSWSRAGGPPAGPAQHLLYVATPGIRDELNHGGAGILVFDCDHGDKFVRRIPSRAADAVGNPDAIKGICASAVTKRLYFCTTKALTCLDLVTDKILWEKAYPGGCDRMSLSPDGKTMYLPSLEGDWWNVVNSDDGDVLNQITPRSKSHNTVFAVDGKHVYLAGLGSPILTVADTATRQASGVVGPFAASIRPFTVNGSSTRCYCCVNDLLGFEIGDLTTGKVIERITVPGFKTGDVKRHGCPSHGIAMTPDESEIWLSDGHNQMAHVFDVTETTPTLKASIPLRDQPGWVTLSLDGSRAYISTGDVIDTKTKKVVATLEDEHGQDVSSEKLLEIDFQVGFPSRAGDQFGRGQKP